MGIENMIGWMESRKNKVSYSLKNRLGPDSYDCSSALFFSLIAGNFLPTNSMGNTETLFKMNGTLLYKISRKNVKRGDIFISGIPGYSNGAMGHTGIFINENSFIHCSYTWNGIHIDKNDSYMGTNLKHNFYKITDTKNNIPSKKSIETVAIEVIQGLWGNGSSRIKFLEENGYNPITVQNMVNEILKKNY
ncbi:peptidoglycan amidohydrolase family protein [Enterococcus casseliflavus]|uniref:peptidoglycan amidohydrolase family protein n=1 Tax=Enterococcus casseliflavus TaxID=37734 RepID=UPI002DB79A52|nr:peptidoglycan amidohydrolase family protein [Enterococcus casseliflavus]MEB6148291.1 hypothetical protein [Enterococcus casseliflavus]